MGIFGSKGPDQYDAIAEEQANYIRQGIADYEAANQAARATIDAGVKTARADLQGYADQGQAALSVYAGLVGLGDANDSGRAVKAYMNSPFKKVVDNELAAAGQEIARQAAGTGLLNSGNYGAALQDRTQEVSQRGLDNYTQNIAGLTQMGYNAAQQQGIFTMSGAQINSNSLLDLGNAQSNAKVAIGAAASGALANRLAYSQGVSPARPDLNAGYGGGGGFTGGPGGLFGGAQGWAPSEFGGAIFQK